MSLYLEHFGMREPPFRITPHTDFFFTGANRGPTLDALIYAITQDEGIVKVTGEVGSGKTMLCRMLLERLPADVESLYLANPSLSRSEILGAIADELGIPAVFGEAGFSTYERAWARPTLEVNGMWGGFQGEGVKTVLPNEAHAKITCRLVPAPEARVAAVIGASRSISATATMRLASCLSIDRRRTRPTSTPR